MKAHRNPPIYVSIVCRMDKIFFRKVSSLNVEDLIIHDHPVTRVYFYEDQQREEIRIDVWNGEYRFSPKSSIEEARNIIDFLKMKVDLPFSFIHGQQLSRKFNIGDIIGIALLLAMLSAIFEMIL